jgi:enamine deaminase RidA (YjgF/YER057c/UK114 family)
VLPARTTFFVSRLKNPDMLVEIEAVLLVDP